MGHDNVTFVLVGDAYRESEHADVAERGVGVILAVEVADEVFSGAAVRFLEAPAGEGPAGVGCLAGPIDGAAHQELAVAVEGGCVERRAAPGQEHAPPRGAGAVP